MTLPSVEDLEARLSDPPERVIAAMADIHGDILILGVGGKMGPSLARMAKRASNNAGLRRRVIGVSRFGKRELKVCLDQHGVETVECDLLDEAAVARLPDASNILFMAGMKFGSSAQAALTWAMNAYLPAIVCKRYRNSRIVAFSTGNIYGLVPVASGGSVETDQPEPVGEYAMSCLGRERMFEYFSATYRIPMSILRINYASEVRYGVLLDLALKVWQRQPIDLAMGYFNTIWLAEANAMALQALGHTASPPTVLNITGSEILDVRGVSKQLGELLGKEPVFQGKEADTALLSNAARAHSLFGVPGVTVASMLDRVADWVKANRPVLNKPTHFEARDGRF